MGPFQLQFDFKGNALIPSSAIFTLIFPQFTGPPGKGLGVVRVNQNTKSRSTHQTATNSTRSPSYGIHSAPNLAISFSQSYVLQLESDF
jgi:hypothetical protein